MALQFNGSADALRAAVVLPPAGMTLSAWVRPSALANSVLFEAFAEAPVGYDRQVQLLADGRVFARVWQGAAGQKTVTSTAALEVGHWSHIAFQHGPTTGGCRLVVNGQTSLVGGPPGSSFSWQQAIRWGAGTFVSAAGAPLQFTYWHGGLAEVAVWSSELTAEELAMLSAGCAPPLVRPRVASLMFYRDLLVDSARPGVGPAVTVSGAPSMAPHPRAFCPVGWRAGPAWRRVRQPLRLDGHAAHGSAALAGGLHGSPVEEGSAHPNAEVPL